MNELLKDLDKKYDDLETDITTAFNHLNNAFVCDDDGDSTSATASLNDLYSALDSLIDTARMMQMYIDTRGDD